MGWRIQLQAAARIAEPLGDLDTIGLIDRARLVLTDSGRMQEETTVLRVPCITLRENTERPITVEIGSSRAAALSRGRSMSVDGST